MRRFLALVLTIALIVTAVGTTGVAEAVGSAKQANAAGTADSARAGDVLLPAAGSGPATWAEGAKRLCGLLGYLSADGADIDLSAYADRIANLSAADDSLYLAILAENGYLSGAVEPIDPGAALSEEDYQQLVADAFPAGVFSQADADKLLATSEIQNLVVSGDGIALSSLAVNRLTVKASESLTLTACQADAVSVLGAAKIYLNGAQLARAYINAGPEDAVYLHVDSDTEIPEIILTGAGDVTVEGDGALGVVRVLGSVASLTVRATCSVVNETEAEMAVAGPDGETIVLVPGGQTDFVLSSYLVSFVTEGTSVPSQTLMPGASIDFGKIATEKEGAIFTAWYEDAGFAKPYSTFSAVEGQLTLYARFIDAADAATVTFETFGGAALASLTYAKGEVLLCKPVSLLYTSKEGFTFGGWCLDEACTVPFGYTDPIEGSMTLYALFTSNEPEQSEQPSNIGSLPDLDWQGEIPLTVPVGMALTDVQANISVAAGAGAFEPALSFRETDAGFAVYGEYYVDGGAAGFEPGATFTITATGGIGFEGYGETVDTLVVAVYRQEVEIVGFAEGLAYINWSHVAAYQPVVQTDVEDGDGTSEPGVISLDQSASLAAGDIAVFYDGEIGADEVSISDWTDGPFDGYVLFAQVLQVEAEEGGSKITFGYASPADYLSDFDVHVSRDADIEGMLDAAQIARLEQDIATQITQNNELKAQMLIAVMTSPETQERLDALYGAGVYTLAGISASIKINKPTVSLSVSGNTATVAISISATIELKNGEDVVLTVTPTLTFEQQVSLSTTINGGKVWIDVSATIKSKSTIRLEITANSGEDEDMAILGEAKETLEKLVTPDGLDDSVDYEQSVNELMTTMQSLIATSLPYNDLFAVPLLNVTVTFHGIVSLNVKLELIGQIGVLATFGIEIIATNGERIGFNYNFLKFKGGSYSEKLPSDVISQIYLIGKLGVRLGLRLTITLILFQIAKASIQGNIYAYAELTGMFFYTVSLLSKSSTYVGALYFEVGLDASVILSLSVDLLIKTVGKSWTVWKARFPLYSKSASSTLSIMNLEKLDQMWASSTANADSKVVFGFAQIPMKTYTLLNGKCVENELLWDSLQGATASFALTIENLVIDGETIAADDPRNALIAVGDGTAGRSAGMVYFDENIAAEYQCEQSDCDVVLTYQNTASSALVKKQAHTFHLSRKCTISTTTVNVRVLLYDWCAHTWGIEAADWDNAVLYETQFASSHAVGGLCAPTETGEIDLAAIMQSALSSYSELEQASLSWFSPTRNAAGQTVQYSVPLISDFCYMTPENGAVRYDVHTETYEYTLSWYLYANRFPSYGGEINYVVNLANAPEASYAFSVAGSATAVPMAFAPDPSQSGRWTLTATRAAFDGTDRPLMISVNGGDPVETGLTINGREPGETVILDLDQKSCALTVAKGDGVSGYAFVSPVMNSGDRVMPGTVITLSAELRSGYRNVSLVSDPAGLSYRRADGKIVFTMPAFDVSVTLVAYRVHSVDYMYNYGGMGLYKTVDVAANEALAKPVSPAVKGLTFRGWYETPDCSGEAYVFGGNVEENLTLYADWTCNVTVDFGDARGQAAYLNDEGAPVLIFPDDEAEYARFTYSTLRVGDSLLDIAIPNYSGYDFKGWYLSDDYAGEPVDIESYILAGGVTLYARWAKILSITYLWNDGERGTYYETVEDLGFPMSAVPPDPAWDYHTFGGWFTDAACTPGHAFDPATELPTGDLTLYARWTADAHIITYDLAGGVNSPLNPDSYTVETGAITLAAPTRAGYDFAGWTGTELTAPTLDVIIPAGAHIDRGYVATWSPVTYSLSYDLVRGTVDPANPETYTVESGDITLRNPTMDKYTFTGWVGANLAEPAMTVIIPTGSTGNRSYTATWHTDDPASQIADDALAAVGSLYTFPLTGYVDGTGADSTLYVAARADIDLACGSYAVAIQLTLQSEGAPEESDTDYAYGFTATVVYTDDGGTAYTRIKEVVVRVLKLVPVIGPSPSASGVAYGQTLASSTLTDGGATYDGQSVAGTFDWKIDTTVPLSKDNASAIYPVIFTPDDTDTYARVELNVAVDTQIGVQVAITAQSRDYVAGSFAATGSYTLTDIGTGGALPALSLTGGAYSFAQATPDDNLAVTFTGYSLVVTSSSDAELYCLLNTSATATASINWITPVLTAPTADISYGDVLRNVSLVGGSATYQGIFLPGIWTWDQPNHQVLVVGTASFSVTFTPTDQLGYRGGTTMVTVEVKKQAIPLPTIASKVYTAAPQTANVDSTADYTVTENAGGTDAGTYKVVLTLTDPEGCRWANDPAGTHSSVTLSFVINPATLTVSGTASVMPLGYGQQLAAGTSDNGTLALCAKTMISGVTVKFGATAVTGDWTWTLTGLTQPLNASDPDDSKTSGSGYSVSASFTAASLNMNNFQPLSQPFTVVVKRATPDVVNCGLSASSIYYLATVSQNPLSDSKISAASAPTNPATGGAVSGSWGWEDSTRVPQAVNSAFNVVFTPSNQSNYTTALTSLVVPFRDKVYVTITCLQSMLPPGAGDRLYQTGSYTAYCSSLTFYIYPDGDVAFSPYLASVWDSPNMRFDITFDGVLVQYLHGAEEEGIWVGVTDNSTFTAPTPSGILSASNPTGTERFKISFSGSSKPTSDVTIQLFFNFTMVMTNTGLTALMSDFEPTEQSGGTEEPTVSPAPTEQPGGTAEPTVSPAPTEQPGETEKPTVSPTPTEEPGETAEPTVSPAETQDISPAPTVAPDGGA
jgi:uncharacterized repeat protein (TIGR02543 family)